MTNGTDSPSRAAASNRALSASTGSFNRLAISDLRSQASRRTRLAQARSCRVLDCCHQSITLASNHEEQIVYEDADRVTVAAGVFSVGLLVPERSDAEGFVSVPANCRILASGLLQNRQCCF